VAPYTDFANDLNASSISASLIPSGRSQSLRLPRIPATISNHQPVPLGQGFSGLELVDLVENEGEDGACVWGLAYELYVDIASIAWTIFCETCSIFPGNTLA